MIVAYEYVHVQIGWSRWSCWINKWMDAIVLF